MTSAGRGGSRAIRAFAPVSSFTRNTSTSFHFYLSFSVSLSGYLVKIQV